MSPAKAVRELSDEQVQQLIESAAGYARRTDVYRRELDQIA
jgi:carbonic anhydrase/acetyltransferase-like protein (isoleucine patch superfamily)